ncbi:lipid-binding protein [Pseudochryseolinea flava]|uniref:Lipid-binding hydrolase n=1 Tax=Pseudochryseolinea flava TaxID=2059302 RepID=A0A364Y7S0_9BACT|nr:lipid-binding protein [Pseudochryseolinea flava]RAW01864.1 hypothetical protein DQQ10_09495 [Pseudochryseolinea flava]
MKNNILILVSLLMLSLASCKTDDIDPGAAANNELSGEWFVEYNHELAGHDPLGLGYTRLLTATTASQSATELIITDEDNARNFRVKAKMDVAAGTFGSADTLMNIIEYEGEDEEDPPFRIKVVVKNGKIVRDAVTTNAGVVADSIYFDLWLEDLGETLQVSGYRRTGFLADEH